MFQRVIYVSDIIQQYIYIYIYTYIYYIVNTLKFNTANEKATKKNMKLFKTKLH